MSGNGGANIIPSMSGLGRNQVWTPDIWAGIDGAVSEAVGQVRVLQKVIPATLGPEPEQTSCTKKLVEMAKTQRTSPAKSERIGHCGI